MTDSELREFRILANNGLVSFAAKYLSRNEFEEMLPSSHWSINLIISRTWVQLHAGEYGKNDKCSKYISCDIKDNMTYCSMSIERTLRGDGVDFTLLQHEDRSRPDSVFVKVEIPSRSHNGSVMYLNKHQDSTVTIDFSGNDVQHLRKDSPQAKEDAKNHFLNIDFAKLEKDRKYRVKVFNAFREFAIFGRVDNLLRDT